MNRPLPLFLITQPPEVGEIETFIGEVGGDRSRLVGALFAARTEVPPTFPGGILDDLGGLFTL